MNEDEIAEAIRFWEHTGGGCTEHHDEACEWQQQCDEPGCKKETTSGWLETVPTNIPATYHPTWCRVVEAHSREDCKRYRRTCSKHSQWGREKS